MDRATDQGPRTVLHHLAEQGFDLGFDPDDFIAGKCTAPDPPGYDARPAKPLDQGDSEFPAPALSGGELLDDPDAAIARYRAEGGTDEMLASCYLASDSLLHVLRTGSQPAMVRGLLKAMVPALSREMCAEAEVTGVSAMMLAEQAAESRVDEVYYRALAGTALDADDLKKAEMLNQTADRFSRRLMKALEQLHRLRRPNVNVKISRASNVNLGTQQVVSQSDDISSREKGPRG
jgi:hypothetical protein